MSREDILKNKFEFLTYQKFRDSEYMNRFLLMVEQNKQPFLKEYPKIKNMKALF